MLRKSKLSVPYEFDCGAYDIAYNSAYDCDFRFTLGFNTAYDYDNTLE